MTNGIGLSTIQEDPREGDCRKLLRPWVLSMAPHGAAHRTTRDQGCAWCGVVRGAQ